MIEKTRRYSLANCTDYNPYYGISALYHKFDNSYTEGDTSKGHYCYGFRTVFMKLTDRSFDERGYYYNNSSDYPGETYLYKTTSSQEFISQKSHSFATIRVIHNK